MGLSEVKKKLFEAAKSGDLEQLQALLKSEAKNGESEGECLLNSFNFCSRTVLHFAALDCHEQVIEWLLSDEGGRALGFTNIFAKDSYGQTALHIAVENGHLACCKVIAEGCKAENGEREQMLNAVDEEAGTVLHVAAFNDREDIIRWLLSDEGGRALGFTDVLARNDIDATALYFAAEKSHLACCKAIVEGCKEEGEREEMLNAVTNEGETILFAATVNIFDHIIPWLLSNDEGGGRSLGFKSETITALSNDSQSALHIAALSGSVERIETLLSGCTAGERIRLFLAVDNHGWTPLHRAALYRHSGAIRELLRWEEAKMIVDARDNRGMTVLHRLACNGGLDDESKREWGLSIFIPTIIKDVVRALLGFDPTTTATAAFVDVNARLEIPEEIKTAAAGSK